MQNTNPHQISLLLDRWNNGDKLALEQLMPLVYDELRRMARGALRRRPDQSIQTSDLLHDTFIKLAGRDEHEWKNRTHFFAVAATAMRHILVDHARAKIADKRGGLQERRSLTDSVADTATQSAQVVALEDALKMLASLDERKCRIVELKFFGGLTNEEAAESLGISVETVKRDWRFARAWLLRELDASD
ncbi:MAG: sigma-70 family RNA polymerase sigma factor [Pyrinomonadaceae bacterium]